MDTGGVRAGRPQGDGMWEGSDTRTRADSRFSSPGTGRHVQQVQGGRGHCVYRRDGTQNPAGRGARADIRDGLRQQVGRGYSTKAEPTRGWELSLSGEESSVQVGVAGQVQAMQQPGGRVEVNLHK